MYHRRSWIQAAWSFLVLMAAYASIPAQAQEGTDLPLEAQTEEDVDSPLVLRARQLMEGIDHLKTAEGRVERRIRLRAMADTLETVKELVMATEALERACILSYHLAEYGEMAADAARGVDLAQRSGDRKRLGSMMNAQAIGVSMAGDDARAAELQHELIRVRRELGDRGGEGRSWHNLAYSLLALFQTPEAIDALREALRCHQETESLYGIAISMASLSNALFDLGQLEEGLAMADSAVIAAQRQGAPILIGSNLNSRGHKRNHLGYSDMAMEDFNQAWELLTKAGIRNVAATGAVSRAEGYIGLRRCEDALADLDAVAADLEELGSRATQLYALAVRGRALLDCGRVEEARGILEATLVQQEGFRDEFEEEGSRAESFRVAGTAYADLAVLQQQLGNLAVSWRWIEMGSAAMLRKDLAPREEIASLEEFQAYLAAVDGAALHYATASADRTIVFWITPNEVEATVIQLPEGFRLGLAATLRLLSSGATDDEIRPALRRMAEVILKPLPGDLEGFERLVVIPGSFTGFPFESLPLSDGKELGTRLAVAYSPSASILLELVSRGAPKGPLVAFADPTPGFGEADPTRFPTRAARLAVIPLPESRAEARAVVRGRGELLMGEAATVAALEDRARHASVLHLATHSLIDATHPSGSALLLAGGDEGLLEARRISQLEMDCDLACLSGCSTAGGYVVAGEGSFGLTRAFLQAGTRSVVATRWDVEDRAARQFMEAFYTALRAGQARDRAMQSARAVLERSGADHRARSAFLLVGVAAEPVAILRAGGGGGARGVLIAAGLYLFIMGLMFCGPRR